MCGVQIVGEGAKESLIYSIYLPSDVYGAIISCQPRFSSQNIGDMKDLVMTQTEKVPALFNLTFQLYIIKCQVAIYVRIKTGQWGVCVWVCVHVCVILAGILDILLEEMTLNRVLQAMKSQPNQYLGDGCSVQKEWQGQQGQ